MVSTLIGVVAGPLALDWVNPLKWVDGDQERMTELTFQFTRLVIGIQVAFAGIDLPAAYLRKEGLSLLVLLLPVMTVAWFTSAGLIMAFVPSLQFVEALVIAATVTPTDPVLSNAIVKGRYAEQHVDPNIRNLISAESGANDGLGYPQAKPAFVLLGIVGLTLYLFLQVPICRHLLDSEEECQRRSLHFGMDCQRLDL